MQKPAAMQPAFCALAIRRKVITLWRPVIPTSSGRATKSPSCFFDRDPRSNRPMMPGNPTARPSSQLVNEQFPDLPYGFLQIG
jgi:hypothetical protein